jgi:hypothetical protein
VGYFRSARGRSGEREASGRRAGGAGELGEREELASGRSWGAGEREELGGGFPTGEGVWGIWRHSLRTGVLRVPGLPGVYVVITVS